MPLLPPQINIALFSPYMDFTQNLGLTLPGKKKYIQTNQKPRRPQSYGVFLGAAKQI